jgi:hypothetical protein
VFGAPRSRFRASPADTDPQHPIRVFQWLICESHDDRENSIVYEYTLENSDGAALDQAHERNRTPEARVQR